MAECRVGSSRAALLVVVGCVLVSVSAPRPARAQCAASATVTQAMAEFARAGRQIATSTPCESGAFASDNCVVAGVRLDASCSAIQRDAASQDRILRSLAQAVRDVRGERGLGCVNRMNGFIADSLLEVFKRTPPFTICCGRCGGQGLPAHVASFSGFTTRTCAVSVPDPGRETGNFVMLNMAPPDGLVGGACGRAGVMDAQPLQANILHEMTHAAGLAGANAHGEGDVTDPETGARLAEDSFSADPVYGCQKMCFGLPRFQTSTSCLACAAGELDAPGRDHPLTASQRQRNHDNQSVPILMQRLRGLQAAAEAGSTDVPQACRDLWRAPGDTGRVNLRLYRERLAPLNQELSGLSSCTQAMGGLSSTSRRPLTEYADQCAGGMAGVEQKLGSFVSAPNACRDANGLTNSAEVAGARQVLHDYRARVLAALQSVSGLDSRPGLQSLVDQRLAGFRCSSYFPAAASAAPCAAELPAAPGQLQTVDDCVRLLPARLQDQMR